MFFYIRTEYGDLLRNTKFFLVRTGIRTEYRKKRTRENSVFGYFSRSVTISSLVSHHDRVICHKFLNIITMGDSSIQKIDDVSFFLINNNTRFRYCP